MYPSRRKASYTANNTSIDETGLVKKVVFPSLPTDTLKQWKQCTSLTAMGVVVSLMIFKTAINHFRSL